MRAVVFEQFGEPPTVKTLTAPTPAPHGVVVRVEATGLCRSDWHGWQGHDPDITLPHVPGHELAGVVEAVGAAVTGWHPGDRVTVPFVCACGSCAACAAGDHQVCERQTQPGFTHWGSFAQYVALDHADVNLVSLPEELSFAHGGRTGLPLRHGVPRGRRAGPGGGGGVGRGARLRRRGPVRGDDRGGVRGPGGRGRRIAPGPGPGPQVRRDGVRGRVGRHGHRRRRYAS